MMQLSDIITVVTVMKLDEPGKTKRSSLVENYGSDYETLRQTACNIIRLGFADKQQIV